MNDLRPLDMCVQPYPARPRSKQHYARLRQVGHDHGRALRGVADRLLAMLIAMLKSGQTYDPNRRSTANLTAA